MTGSKEFIVKVQASLMTTCAQQQCLIYNEDRTLFQEFPMSHDLQKIMRGKDKAFFNAAFDNGELTINEETKEQSW